jgi:hypothetical protein
MPELSATSRMSGPIREGTWEIRQDAFPQWAALHHCAKGPIAAGWKPAEGRPGGTYTCPACAARVWMSQGPPGALP